MYRNLSNFNWKPFCALLCGLILPFAFAPFHITLLAFLSLAILLYSWIGETPARAAFNGFLFGIGFFSVGVSWVYISIHFFGQAPIPLAIFITCIFILYLASFFAAQGYFLTLLFPKPNWITWLLAFPSSWVIFELLRGWLFTGFPWLALGYSQTETVLRGFAPLIGVYGISWLVAFTSGLFVVMLKTNKLSKRLFIIGMLLVVFVTGTLLSTINWTIPLGEPLKTTLIQGNIQQEIKWQPEQVLRSLNLYTRYTSKSLDSDLIIWPEAAVSVPLDQAKDFLDELSNLALQHHAGIITGIPIVSSSHSYNSVIALGDAKGTYNKRHLVPFGEYTPLKFIFDSLLQSFKIPMSNFDRGVKIQAPLISHGVRIAPYVCYEIAFPLELLNFLPQTELLLTVTDDSWFGHSIAAAQHLQMGQMRSLETGRYLLFSSNTGITAIINAKGRIISSIPSNQELQLTDYVQPMTGTTPWMIYRQYPLFTLLLIVFGLALWQRRHKT